MRIAAFLTILLIGSSLAVQVENPLSIILVQVSEHPFGKAIGSLVQMHLKNDSMAPQGKINAILKILAALQKNIETARENAETRYASKAAWCADTIEQLQKEYESAKSAASKSASEKNELIREQSTQKNDLTDSTTNKANLREDLEKAQTDLSKEDTVFEQRNVDYTEAIAACQEAIRLLLQLGNRQPGAVFIQMNQNFGQVKEQLEKHAQNTQSAFIEPILDVLSQLANGTQYDYSTITNIVDLIRTLLQNLQAAQQELQSNHGKVRSDLQNLIANLAGQLETIKVNVDVYDTRLSEIELRLNELAPLINQYETLAEVNGQMLEATIASCKDNDRIHAEQQAARAKQIEIVNALNTYFVSQANNRD